MDWSIEERNKAITDIYNSPFKEKLDFIARKIYKKSRARYDELCFTPEDMSQEAWVGIISANLNSLDDNYLISIGLGAISDATKKKTVKTY